MARIYIGIDIGGTNTRVLALRGFRRQRVTPVVFRTPRNQRAIEAALVKAIRGIVIQGRIAGIGVGVAGVVDNSGRLASTTHLPLRHGWSPDVLRRTFRVPVRMENDARCFLYAEMRWGSARGKRNIAGVVIGTGIGGAIVLDGTIRRGAHGNMGEVGEIAVERGRTFEELGAKKAFERWGDRSSVIGHGVASIVSVFDPELVVLGGGAIAARKVRLSIVRRIVRQFAATPASRTPIMFGKLGDAAQAIGAALLFVPSPRP